MLSHEESDKVIFYPMLGYCIPCRVKAQKVRFQGWIVIQNHAVHESALLTIQYSRRRPNCLCSSPPNSYLVFSYQNQFFVNCSSLLIWVVCLIWLHSGLIISLKLLSLHLNVIPIQDDLFCRAISGSKNV